MSSQNKESGGGREIKVVRQEYGWSIKIKDPNPETRHQPLTPQERTVVRDDVKRGQASDVAPTPTPLPKPPADARPPVPQQSQRADV